MSKAGPSLLHSAFVRAAGTARKQDPQLAKIYYLQMTERGATHLKACCVVASHLAERAWAVLNRGTPYVICDNNGNPATPAEAKKIIAEHWTVPEEIRKRRRSRKIAGKALRQPQPGQTDEATLPAPDRRGPVPRQSNPPPNPPGRRPPATRPRASRHARQRPSSPRLDMPVSIGNQVRPSRRFSNPRAQLGTKSAQVGMIMVACPRVRPALRAEVDDNTVALAGDAVCQGT
jgi:hypothetical protein